MQTELNIYTDSLQAVPGGCDLHVLVPAAIGVVSPLMAVLTITTSTTVVEFLLALPYRESISINLRSESEGERKIINNTKPCAWYYF